MAKSYCSPVQRTLLNIVGKNVLFVDGQCLLCNKLVVWILKYNNNKSILITSYQGRVAKKLLTEDISKELKGLISVVDSVAMLTSDGNLLVKSEAILKILFLMGSFWQIIATIFKCIPVQLRDTVYFFIAKNRFKWFGRLKECQIQFIRNNQLILN